MVSIILARILVPEDYGVIAIVNIFITIANVLVSDGLGNALIQKQDADDLDFSSVFYFNIFFSCIIYMILFISAPLIQNFFGKEYIKLTLILRVLGIRIIIAGINSVQQAYVSKKMIFKKFFWSTLIGTLFSAIVGIVMAYTGFGVWALVFQYLTNATVDTIVLAVILDWYPKKEFSFQRLKRLINFGWKILVGGLLISIWTELRTIIIGKNYTSVDLAYYDKGKQFPSVLSNNIGVALGSVLFPFMANEQNNISAIKETTRMSIRFTTYLLCPILLGFASVAESFIHFVLTDKWLFCVPLLRIFCFIYLFQPIHIANIQAIKALGRSDIYLKLELIKKSIEIIVLIITARISVSAITIGLAIITTLFTFLNMYPNVQLLDYKIKEQLLDYAQPFFMSLIMCGIVYLIGKLQLSLIIIFSLQIFLGMITYFMISYVVKNKEFLMLYNKLLNR